MCFQKPCCNKGGSTQDQVRSPAMATETRRGPHDRVQGLEKRGNKEKNENMRVVVSDNRERICLRTEIKSEVLRWRPKRVVDHMTIALAVNKTKGRGEIAQGSNQKSPMATETRRGPHDKNPSTMKKKGEKKPAKCAAR